MREGGRRARTHRRLTRRGSAGSIGKRARYVKVRAADNDAIRRRGGEENARDPSGLPRRTENARFVRRFTSSYEILLPRNTRVSLKADKKAPKLTV